MRPIPELLEAIVQAGYRPYDWTVATNDRYLAAKREEQTMEEFFLESLAFTLSLTRRTPGSAEDSAHARY